MIELAMFLLFDIFVGHGLTLSYDRGHEVLRYGHLSWVVPLFTFLATSFFLFSSFRCSLTVSRSAGGEYEIWYGYWKLESAEYALALGEQHVGSA